MSDIEHSEDLAESETYPSVEAGMEIITGNGIILGRAISGNYHRLEIDSPEERLRQRQVAIEANNSTDRIDWANDGWEYNMDKIDRDEDFWSDNLDWNDDDPNDFDNDRTDDEDLPGAGVLRPKKPNPNLPPLMMLVDDDDDSPGETLRERF